MPFYQLLVCDSHTNEFFTTFNIKTIIADDDDKVQSYIVDRRYSEFEKLYISEKSLQYCHHSTWILTLLENNARVIQERRQRFDEIMRVLSQYDSIMQSKDMQRFLGIDTSLDTNNGVGRTVRHTMSAKELEDSIEDFLINRSPDLATLEGFDEQITALVDSGVQVKERVATLKEMLESESKPLMGLTDDGYTGLSVQDASKLFPPNINEILNLHCAMLSKMHKRFDMYIRDEAHPFKMYFMCIGDIFTTFVPMLSVYVPYLQQYDECTWALVNYKKENPVFADWMNRKKRNTHGYDISSLAVMVVQRIPRYIMLLQKLQEHSDIEHVDSTFVAEAVDQLSVLMSGHNEQIKEGQRMIKMKKIEQTLQMELDTGRIFLKQTKITMFEGLLELENRYTVYLFDDILILDDEKRALMKPICRMYSLYHVFIVGGGNDTIELQVKEESNHLKIVFPNHKEKAEWMELLEKTLAEVKERKEWVDKLPFVKRYMQLQ